MDLVNLRLGQLQEAPWNPNVMEPAMQERLLHSIQRFGLVQNLVVRPIDEDRYEVLSGNHRLRLLQELGYASATCVVVDLDDVQARLLAQSLNRVEGEDNPGLKAELIKEILAALPQEEVLSLLPETADSLQAFSSLGQQDIATHLRNWQKAQAARLKHLQFQLTSPQLETVDEALARLLPEAKETRGDSPNARGTALFLLCKNYLEHNGSTL